MPTIEQVFSPLNERLTKYENRHVMRRNDLGWSSADYLPEFEIIRLKVSDFSPESIISQANIYNERVENILSELSKELPAAVLNTPRPVKLEVIDDSKLKKQNAFSEEVFWLEELEYYNEALLSLIKVWSSSQSKDEIVGNLTQINLPENFTLPHLTTNFQPKLSPSQTALFLFYLRETELIPYYSDSALSKFAPPFLGRNSQDIRKELGTLRSHKSKADLKVIKEQIERLLQSLSADLSSK